MEPASKYKIIAAQSSKNVGEQLPDNFKDFASLCKIRSGKGIISFNLYEYQEQIIQGIEQYQNTVIAKTRQLGLTELISCYFLYNACINPAYAAVVLSKTQSDTSNIAGRIRKMAASLSEYIQLEGDSLTQLQIKGGGKIYFRSSTPDSARGLESIHHILFDECAFVKELDRIQTAVIPATSMVGDASKLIYVSTPNGKQGLYWELLNSNNLIDVEAVCLEVREGLIDPCQTFVDTDGWLKVVVHWLAHPVYSAVANYLEVQRKKTRMSEELLQQEFNLAFNTADNTVFLPSEINQCIAPIKTKTGYQLHSYVRDGVLWAGVHHEKPSTYVLGLDTATVGSDHFTGVVLDTSAQAWQITDWYYQPGNTCSITKHIDQIKILIHKYKIKNLAIEVNSGGAVILEMLRNALPYLNYFEVKTTSVSKPVMIDRLRRRLQDITIKYDQYNPIIEEMQNYSRIDGKMQASNGYHDDFIMAVAVGLTLETELLNTNSQSQPLSASANYQQTFGGRSLQR